jgi:hypothetical protein
MYDLPEVDYGADIEGTATRGECSWQLPGDRPYVG